MLVVVTLLGSVLVPARQTWRVMRLLRETTEVVQPTRLIGIRLESGLMVESAALEGYVRSGDSVLLARHLQVAADDDRRVDEIGRLARTLDDEAGNRADAVRRRVGEWRELTRATVRERFPRAPRIEALQARQASYERTMREVTGLASYLATEADARRDLIRRSEWLGLLVNALLVCVALAAAFAVAALRDQERRLTVILRRRIEEEAELREVARTLDAAVTSLDVMREVVRGATSLTREAVYVECTAPDDGLHFIVHHPRGLTSQFVRRPRAGSMTEAMIAQPNDGAPMELDSVEGWIATDLAELGRGCAGLAAPLASSGETFGVLLFLRNRDCTAFDEHARRQILTLADLAAAALQRVAVHLAERRALEESERRARQETALRSAAETLAATFTLDGVTLQIARTALDVLGARGAFIEQVTMESGRPAESVIVASSAGHDVPAPGSTTPFDGSLTELVLTSGEPHFVPELAHAERWCTATWTARTGCSAIVAPLGHAGTSLGALFVLGSARTPFRADDLARVQTFGRLATLAYEKVRLLDEAREAHRELERVLRSRSRLMRGFSHDVKNPLGAADGYAELLTTGIYGPLSVDQTQSIERLRRSIHSALALIDDLQEMARAETGNVAVSMTTVDLRDLVRASGEEYGAAAETSGLALSVDLGAGPLPILTDRARVRQIVSNLLSNAIKYTSAGSITLRVRRQLEEQRAEDGDWAFIDVSDTGRGIPPEKRQAIFEEFVRLGASEKSGAGLGLAISQRLAQALGGRITVQSAVGVGSTFTLWLPLVPSEARRPPPIATADAAVRHADRPPTERAVGA